LNSPGYYAGVNHPLHIGREDHQQPFPFPPFLTEGFGAAFGFGWRFIMATLLCLG